MASIKTFQQQGVSLIESMIALLVISIGLLGIAGLQISALSLNYSAYWQSQAVLMAHDMADRMRANQAVINDYVGIDTNNNYNQDCTAQACNTSDMRLADATEWARSLSVLPAGRGIIRSPAANQIDIAVMWDDEGTGATGTNCGNNPNVDLTCYTVTMRTQ